MSMIFEIDLDLAYDDDDRSLDSVLKSITDEFNVTAEVLQLIGPGGGHPEIRFTGSYENLEKWLLEYCGGDATLVDDLLTEYMTARV